MTNTPTPKAVAALVADMKDAADVEAAASVMQDFYHEEILRAGATMLEALAADRDAKKARADAAEAERDRFEAALGRACLVGGTTYLVGRAEAAEAALAVEKAKVARLVEYYEAAEAFAAEKTTGNGTRLVRARAAIAEVQE